MKERIPLLIISNPGREDDIKMDLKATCEKVGHCKEL
jgi:hypothetical protein